MPDRAMAVLAAYPNYFFEWLVWVSFAVVAIPSPLGLLGLISPAVMLFLLAFASAAFLRLRRRRCAPAARSIENTNALRRGSFHGCLKRDKRK